MDFPEEVLVLDLEGEDNLDERWFYLILLVPGLYALLHFYLFVLTLRTLPAPPLRDVRRQANETLDGLDLSREDKFDVKSELEKLTRELNQAKPDPSRVLRYYRRVHEVAPAVAEVIKSSEVFGQSQKTAGQPG